MNRAGTMQTRDGSWRVEVGGLSSTIVWYRLIGPDVDRWLPSTPALMATLTDAGVDLADLIDAERAGAA